MKLVGMDGKPLKSSTPAKEGQDLVTCELLVSNIDKYMSTPGIGMQTPLGVKQVPMQHVMGDVCKHLYSLMVHAGQKEMILRISDKSSNLVQEKRLEMKVLQLVPPNEIIEPDQEENEESK